MESSCTRSHTGIFDPAFPRDIHMVDCLHFPACSKPPESSFFFFLAPFQSCEPPFQSVCSVRDRMQQGRRSGGESDAISLFSHGIKEVGV